MSEIVADWKARAEKAEAESVHWCKEAQRLLKQGYDCVDSLVIAERQRDEQKRDACKWFSEATEQKQRYEKAAKALEPFIDEAGLWSSICKDDEPVTDGNLTLGDLRAARAAGGKS